MIAVKNHFQIFGRREYEKPLTFIKELVIKEIATEGSIKEAALAAVGEDGWIELIALPSTALLHVTGSVANEVSEDANNEDR